MLKASRVGLRKSTVFAADEIRCALLKLSLPSALLFGQPSFSKPAERPCSLPHIPHILHIYHRQHVSHIPHLLRTSHMLHIPHLPHVPHVTLVSKIYCSTAYTADSVYTRALVDHLPNPKNRDGASQPTKTDPKKLGQSLQKNP